MPSTNVTSILALIFIIVLILTFFLYFYFRYRQDMKLLSDDSILDKFKPMSNTGCELHLQYTFPSVYANKFESEIDNKIKAGDIIYYKRAPYQIQKVQCESCTNSEGHKTFFSKSILYCLYFDEKNLTEHDVSTIIQIAPTFIEKYRTSFENETVLKKISDQLDMLISISQQQTQAQNSVQLRKVALDFLISLGSAFASTALNTLLFH